MLQKEVDQISDSFLDAWREFFGQEIEYIRYVEDSTPTTYESLYGEDEGKSYDRLNPTIFYGSIKWSPNKKLIELAGLKDKNLSAIITVVTKELVDKGIIGQETEITFKDLIRVTNRFGKVKEFKITQMNKTVQFSNNFIFTKIGILEMGE